MPQPVLAAPTKAKLTANVAQTNRQVKLQSRPQGLLAPGDLQLAEAPLPFLSDTAFLGVLGVTGITAYFGMMDIAKPQKGETLVVSAAAGATGSIAGQIGKIHGCRVVGIAGGPEKCKWLTEGLGFDAAVNYKQPDWKEKLAAATPQGIDIDFENVGGEIMH